MTRLKRIRLYLFLCFAVPFSFVHGQNTNAVAGDADKLFRDEKYALAMPLYSQLLSLHPKDPFYSYRFGVSMLYADTRDPDAAIRYIETGKNKLEKDDAVLIHFHLGTAYHLTFRFIEAIREYTHFIQLTQGNKKFEKYDAHTRIAMCRNGVELLKDIRDLYVFEKHQVPQESYFRSYSLNDFGGTLVVKPDIFKLKADKQISEQTLAFFTKDQQVAYFSSYGNKVETGKDIYKATKKPDGSWGTPQKLEGAVNTRFDEDYPFILPDGKALYFCSKGHNSMGGYDIFRSEWDSINNVWSKPVNLDFAINTPYDDIMFVTDKDEQYACFSSVRNSGLNQINVFRVRIDVRPVQQTPAQMELVTDMSADIADTSYKAAVQLIQEKSKLEVNTSDDDRLSKEIERRKLLYADNYKYKIPENPTSDDVIKVTFEHVAELKGSLDEMKSKYEQTTLTNEKHKTKADRLRKEAKDIQKELTTESNPERKKQLKEKLNNVNNQVAVHEQQYNNGRDNLKKIEQQIVKQDLQYNKVNFEAGEIQRIASAMKIDTSVVMLKQLIDNIQNYELVVKNDIRIYFPTEETPKEFEVQISAIQNKIQTNESEISALETQQKLYENELMLQNSVVVKTQLEQNIQDSKQQISTLKLEEKLLVDTLLRLQEQKMQVLAMLKLSSDTETDIISPTTLAENQTKSENKQVVQQINTDVNPVLQVQNSNTTQTIQNNQETAVQKTSPITETQQLPEVKQEQNTTLQTSVQTQEHNKAEQLLVQQKNSLVDSVQKQNNNIPDNTKPGKMPIKSEPLVIQVPKEEKQKKLEEILNSDKSPSEKVNLLKTLFTSEIQSNTQKQLQLEKLISSKLTESESISEKLHETDILLRSATLPEYQKQRLEKQWLIQMEQLRANLLEVKNLNLLQETLKNEQEAYKQVTSDIAYYEPVILKATETNKTSKAETSFKKLSTLITKDSGNFFFDSSNVEITVKQEITDLSSNISKINTSVRELSQKTDKLDLQATESNNKAEKASNTAQKQRFEKEAETYSKRAESLKDSIVKLNAIIAASESEIEMLQKSLPTLKQQMSQIEMTALNSPSTENETQISQKTQYSGTLEKMISLNPYSTDFPQQLALTDNLKFQPKAVPETKLNPVAVLFSPSENAGIPVKSHQEEIISKDENIGVLKQKSELALANSLYVYAIPYLIKIEQLNKQISASNDPAFIYEKINELNNVTADYQNIIAKYNSLAVQYKELPVVNAMQPVSKPLPMQLEQISSLATEQYLLKLDDSLTVLTQELSKATITEKTNLEKEIGLLKNEINAVNTLLLETKLIELGAELQANELATKNYAQQTEIPAALTTEIQTLQKDLIQLVQMANAVSEQAEKPQSVEQRNNLLLDAYSYKQSALDKQRKILDLYQKYVPSPETQQSLLVKMTDEALGNTELQTKLHPDSIVYAQTDPTRTLEPKKSEQLLVLENTQKEIPVQQTAVNSTQNNTISAQNQVVQNNSQVVNPITSEQINKTTDSEQKINAVQTSQNTSEVQPEPNNTKQQTQNNTITTQVQPKQLNAENQIVTPKNSDSVNQTVKTQVTETQTQPIVTQTQDTETQTQPIVTQKQITETQTQNKEIPEQNPLKTQPLIKEQQTQIQPVQTNQTTVNPSQSLKSENSTSAQNTQTTAQVLPAVFTFITEQNSPQYVSVYSSNNPIPEYKAPEGLQFKIQISASKSLITNDRFKGISPLVYEQAEGWYRYLAGEFYILTDAVTSRDLLRRSGYPDAFIVAYFNGKRISIAEARAIAKTPQTPVEQIVENRQNIPSETTADKDIISLNTLSGFFYTIQVGVFGSTRNSDRLYGYKPLIQDKMSNGNYRYMLGMYNTFSNAVEARDDIRRTNVPDAFIVIYRNGERITNQQAQQFITAGEKTGVISSQTSIQIPTEPVKEIKTLPENIFFRVQLGAYSNQVPVEVVNSFLSIAGTGIEFFKTQQGLTIYTAGKFSSPGEAELLKLKMQEGGIKDAFVIATDGENNKMTLQEAKRIKNIP